MITVHLPTQWYYSIFNIFIKPNLRLIKRYIPATCSLNPIIEMYHQEPFIDYIDFYWICLKEESNE